MQFHKKTCLTMVMETIETQNIIIHLYNIETTSSLGKTLKEHIFHLSASRESYHLLA